MALEKENGPFDEAGLYIGSIFHLENTMVVPIKIVMQDTTAVCKG